MWQKEQRRIVSSLHPVISHFILSVMKLSDVLSEKTVIINWNPSDKTEAITQLVKTLEEADQLSDADKVLHDVMVREESLSTGLEDGIAYPHGRSDGVDKVVMAFGIVKEGLPFDSRDKKPTFFIPMMVSPRTGGAPHIYFMAEIVKLLEQQDIRDQLLQSNTPAEVYQILTGSEKG